MSVVAQEAATKIATYGGSGAALFGWFTATEWCAVVGALVAVLGLLMQADMWLARRGDAKAERKRRDEEHALEMAVKAAKLKQLARRHDDPKGFTE